MDKTGLQEIRVVLLGKSGAGKSATGNSLLRKEAFEESDNPTAGTALSTTDEIYDIIPGYKLSVTDTPGLCSTSSNPAMTCSQIAQFIGQFSPGPHVIAIVVSASQRVSKEIQDTVNTFCRMFGERSVQHMMFIFTKIDLMTTRFSTKPTPIEDWIEQLREQDNIFDGIFKRCGTRFASINNRIPFGSKAYIQQITRIMDSFISLVRLNNGLHFTSEEFNEIEDLLKEIDKQTGDRSESRQILPRYLVAVGHGVAGGAVLGRARAMDGISGTHLLSVKEAASVLGRAILGGNMAAAGNVAIGGISSGSWGIYKRYRTEFAEKVNSKIKQN